MTWQQNGKTYDYLAVSDPGGLHLLLTENGAQKGKLYSTTEQILRADIARHSRLWKAEYDGMGPMDQAKIGQDIIQALTREEAMEAFVAFLRTIKAKLMTAFQNLTGTAPSEDKFIDAFAVMLGAQKEGKIPGLPSL